MKAEKITYNGEKRIKIDFPYNQELASQLKQISDARWSRTLTAWHIPYTQESFNQLKRLFPDIDYPKKKNELDPTVSEVPDEINVDEKLNVSMHITEKRIFINLPKNKKDIKVIRSLQYSRWDNNQFCWIIPNYKGNADILKEYFKHRIKEITNEDKEIPQDKRIVSRDELFVLKTAAGTLRLIFSFNKALTTEIKKYPYCKWNAANKWWTIPYADKFVEELRLFSEQLGLIFSFEEENIGSKKSKTSPYDIPNFRLCPEEYIEKLHELRYSKQTIKTYTSLFEEFINYFNKFDISNIDESKIKSFMRYLVTERKVSVSYQNQAINAVKFYYERILGGQRKVYYIDRPRRERTLPTVLSEEEVIQILNAVENVKHKAILMTIYSAGLRISEAINLKIKDIDLTRMQIRVEQGKGKKDRYTLLSVKALEILRKYFSEYKPKIWLFEGQKGEEYAARSIQNILKMAVSKTGIKKHITVHTLRHSFATHLLENGTDLRYIQSLLGHKSSKTTEVYTHITTKGFDQIYAEQSRSIKSPLDKLDIL